MADVHLPTTLTPLFDGLPLVLGALGGLFYLRRSRSGLAVAALVYLPCFALAAFVLPMYFVRESSPYSYLLFPTAALTALFLQQRGKLAFGLLLALCLPGHYATERFAMEELAEQLQQKWPELIVWTSRRETDPVVWR